jgi:CII-binding regulator of phage lambda lysogenization HflD
MMIAELLNPWLDVLNALATGAIWVYLRIEKKNDRTNERIDALIKKIDELEDRAAHLEGASGSAVTHNDLSKIYQSINALSEKVNQLVGGSEAMNDVLRLIQARIMEKGL